MNGQNAMVAAFTDSFFPNFGGPILALRQNFLSQWWEISPSPLQRLEKLVSLTSNSNDKKGVTKVQNHLKKEFQKIGLNCEFFRDLHKTYAPLLVAELEGETDVWINLVCHADTVHLPADFPSRTTLTGEDILNGPGVIDNKGGIVVIQEVLKAILDLRPDKHQRRLGIRVICSPNEEIGSPGFHSYFKRFSMSGCAVLGFEPATATGSIIGSRQGNRWYNVEVKGQEAHAGRDHQLGVNAAHEIALKTVALEKLTNYKDGLTVNIGHINAGRKKHNVVAAKAKALVDVRFRSLSQRKEAHQEVVKIIDQAQIENSNGLTTQSKWKIVDDCPPFQEGDKSRDLYLIFKHAVEKIEKKKISLCHAGGCADSNHFNRAGMPILDGLGPIGGEMHTRDEWLKVSSLATRAQAATVLINSMMDNKEIGYVPLT